MFITVMFNTRNISITFDIINGICIEIMIGILLTNHQDEQMWWLVSKWLSNN